ncbi:ZIP family metal transporter [Fictibacillus iocasae]|uniref:ZIP family metal transporter n=1 Tax=Fictibacillus iocasae TaxID=2715437 RepID=A0ABW2NJ87_9BACL
MLQAALWGAVAGSAVLLGAVAGVTMNMPKKWIAWIMAFGTGVLIGAVSFELLTEAAEQSSLKIAAAGFLSGAAIFTLMDYILSRSGGHDRKRSRSKAVKGTGMAIFAGTVLDAIPESVLIGASLIEQSKVSWLLVAAIFLSNFPEGLSSSVGLIKEGYSKRKVMVMWSAVLLLSSIASFCGYAFLQGASVSYISIIGAFAGGGIMAMVSSTMLPEAHEDGGAVIGFISSAGLLTSLLLTHFS